ncbi:MAG: glycosyltransferase family 2 protein [Candidatus Kapabacteria bacterium]|nr:glycosyltransferase family 2 protein [Candidatus Kapabacteria bacterium]
MDIDNVQISVLMPNYNGAEFIAEAIESVLNQTFRDFELIIVEDASTDNSREIIDKYAAADSRIKVIQNETNQFVNISCNIGLRAAKGKYYARLDSDDISMPDRLEKQYEFMEANPDISICGAFCKIIDRKGNVIANKSFPVDDESIKKSIWSRTPIQHSCMFARMDKMREAGFYSGKRDPSEDLELMLRTLSIFKFANLPEYLVKYRIHGANLIFTKQREIIRRSVRLRKSAMKEYGHQVSLIDKSKNNMIWFLQFFPKKFVYWLFYKLIVKEKEL